ncbi:DUF1622 domain-containing protein [Aquiflexum sp.]|uniref:DUF1622 domain-containing protein n=1 Tax=Aquiflexum sp. TaxID=1872584 RepID=UPI00359341B7
MHTNKRWQACHNGGNMSEVVKPIAEWGAAIMEVLGIFIIAVFAIYALIYGAIRLLKQDKTESLFLQVRQSLGRGILLGLEFLVAADIIYTVAVELTFKRVGILAIIVLIRTFLSFSLEVELTGRWPWQKKK